MSETLKLGKLPRRNRVLFPVVLVFVLILAFSISLRPAAVEGSEVTSGGGIVFEKAIDSQFAKPGERVNFTLSYLSNLSETAYNVTVYDWMPSELAFVGSYPFYDGSSEPEIGFYRWSRGRVLPSGNGTIMVSALVNEVPVGTGITNTAHLAYEFGNGTRVDVTSSVTVTVTQAAGVEVFPDQIHSVAPRTGVQTEYNVTLKNTGNALDTFNVILESVAYSPSGSVHDWIIKLFDSEGYFANSPVAIVYDDNVNNRTSWTNHGVVTNVTLGMGESAWFVLRVSEAEGTSGSGDAFLDVHLIARSLFDPNVSNMADENTIVKSNAGVTFAPDYSEEANPGDVVTFSHIIVNSGQTDVIDLSYVSPMGWSYSFFYANSTPLADTDGSGNVDVGVVPRDDYLYVVVKVTVPYSTPAGSVDSAVMTTMGVASGSLDTVNDTTTVRSAPMLGMSKMLVSENPEYEGDVVTYETHIANLGNTRLIKISLDDAFETVCLNFSSAIPVEDSYDELTGNIHWDNLGTLEPGQGVNVTINFLATEGDQAVRESSNVIDAEDEFGNLISATCMNADLTLVGTHTLTVTASPVEAIGAAFNITWTDHANVKDSTFVTPKMIACDEGTTITISYPENSVNNGDERYVFVDYLPSALLSMDSDKTVTLNYRTEYVLTLDQAGSVEPVYATVNGIQLSDSLPQSFWIEKGSVVTFSYPSTVTDSAGTTRYVLEGISGNETDTSVTVTAPAAVVGLYKTQYHLSVSRCPSDVPEVISGEGWYDEGTVVTLATSSVVSVSDGVQYRFDHWSIETATFSDSLVSFNVNAPITATAEFVKQFRFVVASDHDSSEPVVGEHWYDIGVSITASVMSPADEFAGTRYRSTGWKGSGDLPMLGSTTTVSFAISQPSGITWTWITQHRLTVFSNHGLPAPIAGDHWFDTGALISAYVTSPADDNLLGTKYRCTGWSGTGSVSSSGTDASVDFMIEAPSTITWSWMVQYRLIVISDHAVAEPAAGEHWYDVGTQVPASVISLADESGGVRYRFIGFDGTGSVPSSGTVTSLSITITAPSSIEWTWVKQYYLTISSDPVDVDKLTGEGWYDEGVYAPISARTLAGGDGVTTRYRFDNWAGAGVVQAADASTTIKVDSSKSAQAIFVKQFYITMSTNFGDVAPQSGWHDVGSTVSIEAFAPVSVEGKGYVWHGWTGTGDGSYSDVDNPAIVVINGFITETAAWKIDPVVNITISNETIANGDRIVVYGETSPTQSGLAITVFYSSPSGSAFEHVVYTDEEGKFTDTLVLDHHDLYRLLVENGEWDVTAFRLSDVSHENAQGSTTLRVESQPMIPFPPILLAGAILVSGVIAFVPPARNKKNGNGLRRLVVMFSVAGLILGVVSLFLSWAVVAGTVTNTGVAYRIGVQLYPLSQGVVSISDGIKYVGPQVSSMVQISLGPVLSIYLIPAACASALICFYKPKSLRQRNLKITILLISGALIAASVIHTYIFMQNQANTVKAAGIGYGIGLYVAIISCGLTLISALFVTREHNSFVESSGNAGSRVSGVFSRVPAFIAQNLRGTHNLITQSFKAMLRTSTKEEALQSEMQKTRRAYVKERIHQQGLLNDELANLNTLLDSGSIDDETFARLKKVLKMGYESKRDETRGKYGFTNRPSRIN